VPAERGITVGVLYPDLLNIYADRGNLLFLRRRCEWRGIPFRLLGVGLGQSLEPDAVDLVYIGGGQDRDQELCAEDLALLKRESLEEIARRDIPLLAVCGGYQLLGSGYETDHGTLPGAGIADLSTTRSNGPRLVGPCAIQTDLGGPTNGVLAGFENHAGRTRLGDSGSALGRVISGHGNNGSDGTEGYRSGNTVGTYLHGPLLPKNWWFADWLLARCLGIDVEELSALDDRLERAAHSEALRAAKVAQ
jgi:CobQ-like glutamine amidotransferase family enzyme